MLFSIPIIRRNPVQYLLECSHLYGDITFFSAGKTSAVFINHPEGAKRVLQDNNSNYSKDTLQYRALSTITGKGLLTNEGPSWLHNRRIIQPAFTRPNLDKIVPLVCKVIQPYLENWQKLAKTAQPVNFEREIMRLTLEIVAKALFSLDISQEAHQFTDAVLSALDHIIYRARNIIMLPEFIPTPDNLRFNNALKLIDRSAREIIHQRLQLVNPPNDLLTLLLIALDETSPQGVNERQIRDEIVTMLIAGHETVASALSWTFYLLSKNPTARQQMEDEIASILQGRLPDPSDLSRLEITRRVFQESLRLYPPAWVISRTAREADEVLGFSIPAGSLIILSPYTMHRHPEIWHDPDTFNPDRFSPAEEATRPRYSYIPFGGGPHLCIGNNFAMTEAITILAIIAQCFRLETIPDKAVVAEPLVTLRPRDGLPVIIKRLEPAGKVNHG